MVELCGCYFDSMERMIVAKFARDVVVVVVEFNHRFELFLRCGFPLLEDRLFYSGIVACVTGAEVDALNSWSMNVDAKVSKSFVSLKRSLLK